MNEQTTLGITWMRRIKLAAAGTAFAVVSMAGGVAVASTPAEDAWAERDVKTEKVVRVKWERGYARGATWS